MAQLALQQSAQFSKAFATEAVDPGSTLAHLQNSSQTVLLKAQPGTSYRVVDTTTGAIQSVKKVLRKQRDLSVELDNGTLIELQEFFPKGTAQATPENSIEFVLHTGDSACPYVQVSADAPALSDTASETTLWEPGAISAMCMPIMVGAAASAASASIATAAAGVSSGTLLGGLALGGAALGGGGGGGGSSVSPQEQALEIIQAATQDNTATQLTPSQYTNAGVTGVNSNNVSAINSALNTGELSRTQVDTVAKIQTIVDAYNAILAEANGSAADASTTDPTTQQYSAIGADIGAATSEPQKLELLNDIIKNQAVSSVDTIAEINQLASIANTIQSLVAGDTNSTPPSTTDFETIGVTGVTTDNLPALINVLTAQADDGSATNTVAKLQALVDAIAPNINLISIAAEGDTANTLSTTEFTSAGVINVDNTNLPSVLDALNTTSNNGTATDTTAKIQTIVDAYNAILAEANGSAADATSTNPTTADYTAIGVPSGTLTAPGSTALLNDIIAEKSTADVDTVAEIAALAVLAQNIQDVAQGSSTAVPVSTFTTLGVTGVTDDNITALNNLIRAQADDGTATDTVAELQALVTQMNTALVNLSAIAQANSATSTGPTLSDYAQAGMSGVTADNVAAINEILNTSLINGAATDTAVKIQNSINAFNKIEAEANATATNPNGGHWLTVEDFANVGVSIATSARYLLNSSIAAKTVADVNTVAEIAELARISEAVIAKAADTGTLTAAELTTLGIVNANDVNMPLMNATVARTIDTGSQVSSLSAVQTYMNKVHAIVQEANGSAPDDTETDPVYSDYVSLITVNYMNNTQSFVNLMNDFVGTKTPADIDTIAELQAMGSIVKKIDPVVKGTGTIYAADLQALGVNTNYDSISTVRNFVDRMFALEPDDGSTTDSIAELQAHMDAWSAAQTSIQAAAEANNANSTITYATYLKTGTANVIEANVASYNSSLDTAVKRGVNVDSLQYEVQALVHSYNNILTIANGSASDAGVGYTPTSTDYNDIGVSGYLNPDGVVYITSTISVNLLNDVIRNKTADQVDTAAEIDALASAGMRILRHAGIHDLNPQVQDFVDIGITGVTTSNLAAILSSIDSGPDDGSAVDSLYEIQTLVNQVNGVVI
ncbi:hypothetical protein [Limnohabitans sp.]|uniref:beta strand repeat-containing protein n=1 Tax=Limnohabitans sp. TaxID=1907725 RepID=UPI00311E6358